MSISENLKAIKEELPGHVSLVAVSKTKPVADLMEAYRAGQRIFGENKIQEMTGKWQQMPEDTEWHMIGHVQRNKVKYMAEYVSLVHGVDSLKLLREINKQAAKYHRSISCLLQVHIAEEETKFGMDENEVLELLRSEELHTLTHVKVVGLMGMATFTDNEAQVRKEFSGLKKLFDKSSSLSPEIQVLSMGMSGDYRIAIDCGSTMVRIGSSIFGARNYH
ncbi:YggS family pyridoxal phosphate-dependent enzyme [Sinomicrobium soli]|uniref:YggS family pyridoxal phosphate-dependent enzyme n=1 Tax=Sinomicrobium sp. N-1-3-6 TaxID=2219864 RepID=UPI000DCBFA03|nr:YggS family pyridoxal phosphate-dependent enzyme [Sinomicrobium sp. N-1-3-6]RAV29256.1 YggS family pyridoxal phosphate-dependent enzyme [Sinomicrobium sp. N-1-3-6]